MVTLRKNVLFSTYIALIPIFSIYISPIYNLDLATFCMILFSPFVIVKHMSYKKSLPVLFSILILYLVLVTGISLFTEAIYSSTYLIILRTGKFIFIVYIGLIGILNGMFNYRIAVKALKTISIIASIIMILQFITYRVFGFSFPAIIRSLTVVDVNRNVDMYYNVGNMFRPSSLFLEPSHFFQYVIVTLTLLLFSKAEKNKRGYLSGAIIITIAVLLSLSGMGFVIISFLWVIWYLFYVKDNKSKKSMIKILFIFILIIIAILALMKTDIVNQTTSRLFTTQVGANAIYARTIGYDELLDLDLLKLIFGNGYGNILPNTYFTSVAYTTWTSGVLGVILMALIFTKGIFTGDRFAKIFFLVYFVMVIISEVFIATDIVFYFAYLLAHEKSTKV